MSQLEMPGIVEQAAIWLMKPEEYQAYEASLWRAFIRDGASSIILDSNIRFQRFTAPGVAWGLENGLLIHTRTDGDDQGEVYEFRLTDAGRERLTQNEPTLKDIR